MRRKFNTISIEDNFDIRLFDYKNMEIRVTLLCLVRKIQTN